MPLTQLDPKTALVVIDLQKGLVNVATLRPVAEIAAHSARLAKAFRDAGQTVALINVTGRAPGRTDAHTTDPSRSARPALAPDFSDYLPELDAQQGDILVSKQRVGAFIGTSLHQDLQARGVTQVIFTGVSTSHGVEASARSAYDHGYHVVVVTDAMTDHNPEAHEHAVGTLFPRIAETTTTNELLEALTESQARPAAR